MEIIKIEEKMRHSYKRGDKGDQREGEESRRARTTHRERERERERARETKEELNDLDVRRIWRAMSLFVLRFLRSVSILSC